MGFVLNGGITPLLETLKAHALDEDICISICASIELLGLSEICVNKIIEKNGIVLVIGAIQNHIASENVCYSGCSALMTITNNSIKQSETTKLLYLARFA